MSRRTPPELERLLAASPGASFEEAWTEFLQEYSRLILYVARSFGGPYDAAMDRYAHVVERLRQNDCRRLREYTADGRGRFTTWLLVVARRLCVDEARQRYGRLRGGSAESHRERRALADLVAAEVDPDALAGSTASPEDLAHASVLNGKLGTAIAALEPADRLLLRLRYHDEVPVTDIARICSFPNVFHVYRRLNGIHETLRRSLGQAGIRDAAP
jgi:RNA polymerase sigma factor (sigma-70 family)